MQKKKGLRASMTVEAAGVMAVVLTTLMVLMGQAMSWSMIRKNVFRDGRMEAIGTWKFQRRYSVRKNRLGCGVWRRI